MFCKVYGCKSLKSKKYSRCLKHVAIYVIDLFSRIDKDHYPDKLIKKVRKYITNIEDLKFDVKDLLRMANIIRDKSDIFLFEILHTFLRNEKNRLKLCNNFDCLTRAEYDIYCEYHEKTHIIREMPKVGENDFAAFLQRWKRLPFKAFEESDLLKIKEALLQLEQNLDSVSYRLALHNYARICKVYAYYK